MSAVISFGDVDRLLVFGGGHLLAEFAPELAKQPLPVTVICAPRHLDEAVGHGGATLAEVLAQHRLPTLAVADVNADPRVTPHLTPKAFGLAIGPAWIFRPPVLAPMTPRMVNFHGIRLPQYRGGAHYSWQIMRRNRQGACNIQLIAPKLDAGEVIKTREYFFPSTARLPRDYFEAAMREELAFLGEFLAEVRAGKEFPLARLQESFATYFPSLNTLRQGFIDWQWATADIETFVAAFDEPYRGASTYLDGRRVFVKDAYAELGDGAFHPFQIGIVYRRTDQALFVATRDGALVVRCLTDESGADVRAAVKVGQRLHTPRAVLEEAMAYRAVYDAKGLKT